MLRKTSRLLAVVLRNVLLFVLGLALPLCSVAQGWAATTYDAVADFSRSANPNPPWTYLYDDGSGPGPQLLARIEPDVPAPCFGRWNGRPWPDAVYVFKNYSANPSQYQTITLPPHLLALAPQRTAAVTRWTAPQAGRWSMAAYFQGIDIHEGSHRVQILKNSNVVLLEPTAIDRYDQKVPYNATLDLQSGDTIDFIVNGNAPDFVNLTTGLSAHITLVSAPSAAASMPADELPKTGEKRDTLLYVRTDPPGAKVILDNKELGTSSGLFQVEPGIVTITVKLDGHEQREIQVTIRANGVTRVVLELKPQAKAEGDHVIGRPPQGMVEPVSHTVGVNYFRSGDSITITEVKATSPDLKMGDKVIVKGYYTLASEPKASLCLFATSKEHSGPSPIQPEQQIAVNQGQGKFELSETLDCKGYLHVTFYSVPEGKPFGGLYFGTAKQMEEIKHWDVQSRYTEGEPSRQAYVIANRSSAPYFDTMARMAAEAGLKVVHGFNMGYDMYLPQAKGHVLLIETHHGKPIVPAEVLEAYFPNAMTGLTRPGKFIRVGDTSIVFLEVSEQLQDLGKTKGNRAYVIGNLPYYHAMTQMATEAGLKDVRSFNTEYDTYLPQARGHVLLVETHRGKPIVPAEVLEKYFPDALTALTHGSKSIRIDDTSIVFVEFSEQLRVLTHPERESEDRISQ